MRNKARELNAAMMDSNNLLADTIAVNDGRGRFMNTVDLATAKQMVDSGRYYIETTEDIVLM